jgi:hypothetical protein
MIAMTEESVDGIPVIHVAPAEHLDKPLPTVFLFHGFTSSKELTVYLGYMIAKAGIRVVLPEADGHGARFDGNESARPQHFWDIIKRNVDELPFYCEHYTARGLIDRGRIGVAGTSMGGFTALGCMARYDWIRAVAAYMGSGYFLELSRTLYPPEGRFDAATADRHAERMQALADYEVVGRLDRIGNRPLLVWHGERDDIVPFDESRRLRDELASQGLDGKLHFINDPNGTHKLSMAASVAGMDFFERNL